MPLYVDTHTLVSFVFNRTRQDFTDRERDLLEVLRPVLADLFRTSVLLAERHAGGSVSSAMAFAAADVDHVRSDELIATLTPREREVLGWVSAGKTNRQIADIVGASARTIAKHLERVYDKLGVETRTAAAMRSTRGGLR